MTIDEHELRQQLRHLDDELSGIDERVTLDEMSHDELVDLVRALSIRVDALERRPAPRGDRHHWEGDIRVFERANGSRYVRTFGGDVDVEPAQ